MANAQEHRGSSPAERWFDHVVRALTVAAIISSAVWLTDMRSQIVGIQKDLGYLTQQIGELKGLTDDRYTGTQARRDLQRVIDALGDHETRLRALENARGG